jgi:hypothetical protein
MADEDQAIAEGLETATDPAVVDIPTVPDEPERIPGPEEVTAGDEATAAADDDVDELEFGFEKYSVPKKLKTAVEEWRAATTKKEQEVSASRKTLESRETEINQRLEATEAELDTRANLRAVNTELGRFKDFDWTAYQQAYQVDPMGAEQAWNYAQHLRNQKAELEGVIGQKQNERTERAQQELAKRVQDTLAHAQKSIPGFKPETTIPQLVEFAQTLGVPEEAIKQNWSPTFVDLLHLARIGKLTVEKQATAPRAPAVPVAPLATVGGKSTPASRGNLAEADMDSYVRLRKQGVGGKPLR